MLFFTAENSTQNENLKIELETKIQSFDKDKLRLAELESQEFEFETLMKNKDLKVKSLCEEIERLKSVENESLNFKPEVQNTGKIEELEDLNADLKLDLCETKDELEKIKEQMGQISSELEAKNAQLESVTLEHQSIGNNVQLCIYLIFAQNSHY